MPLTLKQALLEPCLWHDWPYLPIINAKGAIGVLIANLGEDEEGEFIKIEPIVYLLSNFKNLAHPLKYIAVKRYQTMREIQGTWSLVDKNDENG
jgi:hypothetical protein